MKNFYRFLLLTFIMSISGQIYAQKTLRLTVTNISNSPGPDCDGTWNDSDFHIEVNAGDGERCYYNNGCNCANNLNPNWEAYNLRSFYSRDCWPTGARSVAFYGEENDDGGDCDEGGACSRTDGWTFPSYAAAAGNYRLDGVTAGSSTISITGCTAGGCGTAVTYSYTGQWVVAGSFSGSNLDANSYVINKTCATAIALTANGSGTLRSNDVTQCTETWYSYSNTGNLTTLTFDPTQNASNVDVYYSASNSCADMCWVASGGGIATVRGAKPGTYFVRLSASNDGNTDLNVTRAGGGSNDNINQATSVSITPGTTYNGSFNNTSYSNEQNEPFANSGYNTAWYTFTTPVDGLTQVTAAISENGGNNSFVTLYQKGSANNCPFSSLTQLAHNRWCSDNGGSVTYDCLPGNTTYYVQYGTASNFALCIGGENTGGYNISISTPSTARGKDDICNAHDFGTIGANYNSGDIYYTNKCLTTQAGEPRTGNMSNTMWYKFTTPATGLTEITIEAEEDGEGANYTAVALYQASGLCGFTGLTERGFERWCGANGGSLTYECLPPNTTFYIQLGTGYNFDLCTDLLNGGRSAGRYRLKLTSINSANGPDNVCAASSIGTINGLTGTLNLNNQSNRCATVQSGEPSGGQSTVWYTFTTGATVAKDFNINMDAYSNGLNSDIYVYRACNTVCPSGSPVWGNLELVDNFYDVNPLPGEFDAGGTISGKILPNTTYYIRADGTSTVGEEGEFNINMSFSGGAYVGNDLFCAADANAAYNFGTVTKGTTTLAKTGTTVATSIEDYCSVNEPRVSGNDLSVWYKFITPADGATLPSTYRIYVDGSGNGDDIFPIVNVFKYTGAGTSHTSCGPAFNFQNLTHITEIGSLGLSTDIDGEFCADPSSVYYLQVTGYDINESGIFQIRVEGVNSPVNDRICNAKTVPVQTIYTYNHYDYMTETNINGSNCNEPQPAWAELGTDNDRGVWYYIGQVPGRTIVVDANSLSGDNLDLQMALYSTTSSSCSGPLTEVSRQYDGIGVAWDEDAYFNCLDPTKYYWLMVDGSDVTGTGVASALEQGNFSIRFWFPEEGEITFCGAENLGTVPNGGAITKLNLSNICGTAVTTNMGVAPASNITLPSGFTLDNAVIYKFVAPASGSVKIEGFSNPYYPGELGTFAGDVIDMQLAVFEQVGAACGSAMYYPKGNKWDITDGFGEKLIVNCLNPGQTYYLMVDGSGLNTKGYFDLKISDYGISTPNDFLCNATPIPGTYAPAWVTCNYGTPTTITAQNNYCATITNDLPSSLSGSIPSWDGATSGVWYKFIAPKSGKVTIEGKNSFPDAIPPYDEPEISVQLAVFRLPGNYQGTCLNLSTEKDRLELVASDFDGLLHDEDFTVECLIPDSTYYLLVDGSAGFACPTCDRGEFYLTITPDPRDRPATNELPCDAVPLGTPVMGSVVVGTKIGTGSAPSVNSVPTTGYGALKNLPRTNPAVCQRAENNFCKGNAGEPGVSGGTFLTDFSPDKTVWYEFIAPATGEVLIDAYNDPASIGDQIDLQIAVYESSDNTCSGTFVPIKAEYQTPPFSEQVRVQCLNPGQKYWILIDGSGLNTEGYFELRVQAVAATLSGPPNDDICNATTVTYPASIGTTTTINNQTNRCATIQTIYSEPTTFTKDADVWYKFTTPATAGPHAVEVEVTSGLPWPFGDAMDPQIALYKGSCPSTFTLVDDGYSAAGLPFYESFEFHCLEPSTTYYLMVDGSGLNEQGNFRLDVTRIAPHPLPTNDNICVVGTTPANGYLGVLGATTGNKVGNTTTNWHNFCSSVETNETSLMTDGAYGLDQTVWFHFRTPNIANNIDVEIRALNDPNNVGDQIDLQMLLVQGNPSCPFSGSTFSTLTPIESSDPALTFNATINVCLPPNTDFYIQVDGSGLNKQGYFTMEVENKGIASAPANDNICNAKTMTVGAAYAGYLNDNNICATLEASEKQNTPGSVQRSVWYKFVAPTSADVSIEVKGNSWVPFTQNYFLPDVTLWEVNDGTNTVGACGSVNWNKLDNNWHQDIPNSLANGVYPTVVLTPLCLKPGYTYYVQVDGINGIGLDGYFDIRIKDNQPAYTGPANNECAGATTLTVGAKSCQVSGGSWSTMNYGDPTWSRNPGGCTANCGDIWYKFTMPAACGNNTMSFVKIEGNDELGALGTTNSNLAIAAYRGTCGSLTYIKCNTGGSGQDPDFSLSGTPGETIYLQVWDQNGDDFGKNFQLCISEQKSADECVDATQMQLDVPYCFSVAANIGETPNAVTPGSGLLSFCGSKSPEHSTYFKFTTDAAASFCDDYYMYINLPGLAKEIAGASLQNCFAGATPSVEFSATIWEVVAGGSLCTPGASNVTQRDCFSFNDCGTGSFGSNVSGPHGNGGVINDTVWFNLGTGFAFQPNKTYYIVLDYEVKNPLQFSGRTIMDGTIEIGRRCKGRTWEYTTAPVVTTNKYCTSSDGWRHYYDDKGTTATGDDRYVFSVYPNGNTFEGTATITLDNNFHRYEDFFNHFAEYVMRRRWDFQVTSGSINPAQPVKVRFYYQNSEKWEIINEALWFKDAYPSNYEDFEWFKSENGHVFSPYTDVNPKVISVGPNGYSETGCLSYWNVAGTYVGPPGVQRCIQKVITDWDDNNTYHQWCNGIRFAEYNGLTGFSGGTGGAGDSPWDVSPLPVELTSFTGYHEGGKNVLTWTTVSEINTLKFEVEKSTDGVNFSYVGEKAAAGNSDQPLSYTLNDEHPVPGNNYYRLKMVDQDLSFDYSNIINIKVADAGQPLKDAIISVFPNPTTGKLNVVYQSTKEQTLRLQVFNAIAQSMLNELVDVPKGLYTMVIDAQDYAKGMYILSVQSASGEDSQQVKFVKE